MGLSRSVNYTGVSLHVCLLLSQFGAANATLWVLVQLPHRVFGCGDQTAVHDERHNFGDFGG